MTVDIQMQRNEKTKSVNLINLLAYLNNKPKFSEKLLISLYAFL